MRIIVVDDEKLLLREMCNILKGFEEIEIIGAFTNSIEALEFIRGTGNIQAVFLDVNMPKMNGLELAERISELSPLTELVFVTAFEIYAIKAFEMNAFDYILKPVDDRRIGRTVERLKSRVQEKKILSKYTITDKKIQYFGKFDVLVGGCAVRWASKKTCELFAFLASRNGSSVHKEILAEELWPDTEPKRSLANLQTTIYRVRQAFAELECDISLTYNNDSYRLNLDGWASDIEQVTQLERDFATNSATIKTIFKDGYMAENGWIWAYSLAADWDVRIAAKLEKVK